MIARLQVRRRHESGTISMSVLNRARRRFAPAFVGQRRRLALALVLGLLATGVELLKPWPTKVLFDQILIPITATPTSASANPERTIAVLAAAIVVLAAAGGACTMWATTTTAQVARKVVVHVRTQLFEHIHRLGLPFHSTARTGDLLVRLMGDVNLIRDALVNTWLSITERGALVVGMSVVLFLLDPALALCALAPLPLLGLRLNVSARRLRDTTRKQRRREGAATDFAVESLHQIRVIKAYAREQDAARDFGSRVGAGERAGVKATRIAARMAFATETITGICLALVVFVGALRVRGGRLTVGELLVATSYSRAMFKPIRKISREGGRLSKATAATERVLELLEVDPEPMGTGRTVTDLRGAISFQNVRVRYPSGVDALRGLSFEVPEGSLAVIEGSNGSGKSTTLGVLLRLLPVESGLVLVDDRPHDSYELQRYRQCFSYVPQEIHLFAASVRENILYGRPGASDQDVERAARLALFDEVVATLPDGYDSVLGERGATLSGGQARRLMLARAALRDASILILDEPLAGLDPDARRKVATATRSIAAGRTAVVINHGEYHEFRPDVVVHLEAGKAEWANSHLLPSGLTADGVAPWQAFGRHRVGSSTGREQRS